jgi:hypothetical protein
MLCKGATQDFLVKRFDLYFLYSFTLALILFVTGAYPTFHLKHGLPKSHVYTTERLTQHAIWMKDDKNHTLGLCTGTAVGQHAILLATHCLEDTPDAITIDLATETHEIVATAGDGCDHTILLIDGTPLYFIENVKTAEAVIGETVTIYGVGGEKYPPVPKYGKVTDCEDPSDMDAQAGQFCASIHAIPGDSGSAVFNAKGEILGLITYSDEDTYPTSTRDYALGFTQKQLDQAAAFDGKDVPKPVRKLEPLPLPNLFGPF